MFLFHPFLQLSATAISLYVLVLGISRFRRLHLKHKTVFQRQRHVFFGTATLLLWLVGMGVGLVVVKTNWHGFLITGTHGNRLAIFLVLILLSLGSGWYMHWQKGRRIFLPLAHGAINFLLVILALLQILSGWQVYKSFGIG